MSELFAGVFGLAFIVAIIACIPAYITHLWWSLSGLFSGSMDQVNEYIIAVVGIFMPPVGAIHGFWLWFS